MLSDKDLSKINAFLCVFPQAKHQLCFWHCLHAVKTWLSILCQQPKHYDVLEAKKEFDWIDENFVPVAQSKNPQNASRYDMNLKMVTNFTFLGPTCLPKILALSNSLSQWNLTRHATPVIQTQQMFDTSVQWTDSFDHSIATSKELGGGVRHSSWCGKPLIWIVGNSWAGCWWEWWWRSRRASWSSWQTPGSWWWWWER